MRVIFSWLRWAAVKFACNNREAWLRLNSFHVKPLYPYGFNFLHTSVIIGVTSIKQGSGDYWREIT